jgi:hypothetical protein
MSAFVVAKVTIDRVVSALAFQHPTASYGARKFTEFGYDLTQESDCSFLGRDLWAMNVAAVNQRYEENEAAQPYTFTRVNVGPMQAVKSMKCLRYQCSEGDVPDRPLYKALDYAIASLAEHIVSAPPEYERAKWE